MLPDRDSISQLVLLLSGLLFRGAMPGLIILNSELTGVFGSDGDRVLLDLFRESTVKVSECSWTDEYFLGWRKRFVFAKGCGSSEFLGLEKTGDIF